MAASRLVYLVGDNEDCLGNFKSHLLRFFPSLDIQVLNRTKFWNLPTYKTAKFIFVFPFTPRYIIYDESHPARSFHKEIEASDWDRTKTDSVLIVVYGQHDAAIKTLCHEDIQPICDFQPHLQKYEERKRLVSLGKSLNNLQVVTIAQFLDTHNVISQEPKGLRDSSTLITSSHEENQSTERCCCFCCLSCWYCCMTQ